MLVNDLYSSSTVFCPKHCTSITVYSSRMVMVSRPLNVNREVSFDYGLLSVLTQFSCLLVKANYQYPQTNTQGSR